MAQYNFLTTHFSNSQLNKIKSGIKNGTEVTLKVSSNVVGDSNDEENVLQFLTHVLRIRKAFRNNFSANVKLSKTQLHKIGQSTEFLGRLLLDCF